MLREANDYRDETMNFESTYIRNIISANNNGSLAVVIGAGISKSSETETLKLPNWNDLITDLKHELNDIEESDYLKVAQLYYLAFGEYSYYKKLKDYFPDYISPSKIHEIILDINPHIIITTNWDVILEKSIEENAYVYDIICSDTDLVKSSLPNKLIKMHGDFKNNNIVFKEDDYINYQHNFPLIENYVKSILSTHTILFIGYSYNDINLKQILNWIKNHSNVRPPMYLATFEENLTQHKYLENHGISSITLKNNDQVAFGDDEYSNKMYTFLNKIKNQDELRLLSSDSQVIDFVLEKIEPLNDLNGILIEQVQESLTNCGFIFDNDSHPILEFYQQILTTDMDSNKRKIYHRFVDILKDVDIGKTNLTPNLIKIFNILSKARIKGIVISNDTSSNPKEYYPIIPHIDPKNIEDNERYYNFEYSNKNNKNIGLMGLFEQSFSYYNLKKYEEAFQATEDAVSLCLKEKNYTSLFIAMFNRNVLLRTLKFSFSENRDKYKEIKEYDLKERYYKLPKILRLSTQPIYEFVDLSKVYKYIYTTSKYLKDTEDSRRTIEAGGMVINSNVYQYSSKHENIVNFILKNKIMIEDYNEYRVINKYFIEISILRQIQNSRTSLSKTEIYSCIKFLKDKEIKQIFNDFYNSENLTENKKLEISNNEKNWLINISFPNIVNEFLNGDSSTNNDDSQLKNILFILSLINITENEIDGIFILIKEILLTGSSTLDIFQSVNLFLGIQYKLYKMIVKENTIIDIVEGIINKIIYKKYNGYFFHAITSNRFSNLYGYAQENNVILKNAELISRLIKEVDSFDIDTKMNVFHSLILNLYELGSDEIKNIIKTFALNIDISSANDKFNQIIFKLILVIYEFKVITQENIDELEAFLEKYKGSSNFFSGLYTLRNQVEYLIKNKNLSQELDLSSKIIKESIDLYEKREMLSIL